MVPLRFADGTINTLALATKDSNGFATDALDTLEGLALPITVIVERLVAEENTAAILTAYLGRGAARHVLGGVVQSGQGQLLQAVILFGDLRGYTTLSATLAPRETVALVNAYFDCIVDAVENRGGHILKFIGDAFLAVFPLEEGGRPICADATIGAIREIRIRLSGLNRQRTDSGLPPLSHGVGVHFGPVIYGNVGSSMRLDFTVIGQEVNVAARVQEATKSLGIDYLFTDEYVAAFGDAGLLPIGPCELRELDRTIHLYKLNAE
jgi:adenylate cyclase